MKVNMARHPRTLLNAWNLRPRKSLGQNFLTAADVFGGHGGGIHDAPGDVGGGEKVLAEAFSRPKVPCIQQGSGVSGHVDFHPYLSVLMHDGSPTPAIAFSTVIPRPGSAGWGILPLR
jgi:hypothetical protein